MQTNAAMYARDIAAAIRESCEDVIAVWTTRSDGTEILFLVNGYSVRIYDDPDAGGITWSLWDSNDDNFETDGWNANEHTDAQNARFVEEIIEIVRRLGNEQSPFDVY